jgi:hypothetical protein
MDYISLVTSGEVRGHRVLALLLDLFVPGRIAEDMRICTWSDDRFRLAIELAVLHTSFAEVADIHHVLCSVVMAMTHFIPLAQAMPICFHCQYW